MCTNYRAPAKKPISGSLGHDDALVLVGAEYRFFFGNPHGERKTVNLTLKQAHRRGTEACDARESGQRETETLGRPHPGHATWVYRICHATVFSSYQNTKDWGEGGSLVEVRGTNKE